MASSSILQKILQRVQQPATTATRILASLHNPKTPAFSPNPYSPSETVDSCPRSVSNTPKGEDFGLTHLHPWAVLPVYPFGSPVLPSGSTQEESEGEVGDGSGMWADSVKKKRKKKMNKHKYKKLRKRIGRRT